MKYTEAFELIANKVGEAVAAQGIARQKVGSADKEELAALFTGETAAYTVVYYSELKHMVLKSCAMTDEGPDNEWKTLATWMFDEDNDSQKEAESIANDFVDTLTEPVRVKAVKNQKKKKKSEDEGNADPLFLCKRFVNIWPELKDEIKNELDYYDPFRGVTFVRKNILPRLVTLLNDGNKADYKKLSELLSHMYNNGDMDTRSIITIVILNSIDGDKAEIIEDYISPELKKAWESARKFKNKTVKPEKPKKQKKSLMERLALPE